MCTLAVSTLYTLLSTCSLLVLRMVGTQSRPVLDPSALSKIILWLNTNKQNFYLQRQGRRGDDTYAIYPDNGGSVQQAPNWRLHVERGVTPQLWVMKQYHNQANTYTITQAGTDPSLGWIDNGHGKQLHLTVLDPNNVVLQQRYKIVRA
ncbi:hypothetical protein V8B97DRAFT_1972541 [Scleroderma yunnanense]